MDAREIRHGAQTLAHHLGEVFVGEHGVNGNALFVGEDFAEIAEFGKIEKLLVGEDFALGHFGLAGAGG